MSALGLLMITFLAFIGPNNAFLLFWLTIAGCLYVIGRAARATRMLGLWTFLYALAQSVIVLTLIAYAWGS